MEDEEALIGIKMIQQAPTLQVRVYDTFICFNSALKIKQAAAILLPAQHQSIKSHQRWKEMYQPISKVVVDWK